MEFKRTWPINNYHIKLSVFLTKFIYLVNQFSCHRETFLNQIWVRRQRYIYIYRCVHIGREREHTHTHTHTQNTYRFFSYLQRNFSALRAHSAKMLNQTYAHPSTFLSQLFSCFSHYLKQNFDRANSPHHHQNLIST